MNSVLRPLFTGTSGLARQAKPLAVLAMIFVLTPLLSAQSYEERIQTALKKIDKVASEGPFHPSWESLEGAKVPEWYRDAKFGIFIHWGVYSVPAFDSEWYPRNMYLLNNRVFKHHLETYGRQSKFGYKDFIPLFKAENFSADHWAELFRKAGARYVVPVAEHHDGFPMYDSSFTDWCAAKMGPKRDIVGELATAVRKQGLHFGASSHRAEHWWFYEGGTKFDSDVQAPRFAGLYGPARPRDTQPDPAFLNDWLARAGEIVDKFHPDLMWFDWWIEQPVFQPYLQKFAAYYYNQPAQRNQGVAINYKHTSFHERAAVLDIERGILESPRPLFWQTDTSISTKSWGYIQNDVYRSAESIVDELADIVSKNGSLLLNVGPRSDGTIPEAEEAILLDVGRWLSVNAEAIYGTRPWKVFGEGPTKVVGGQFKDTAVKAFTAEDIRFTARGDTLYAIALRWPATAGRPTGGKLTIKSLAAGSPLSRRRVKTVQLLGSKAKLKWGRNQEGLTVELPAEKPSDFTSALKIRPVDPAPARIRSN